MSEWNAKMPDMKPIITQIMGQMHTEYENGAMKAVQEVGFNVDKDRLIQALTDASSFYEEGYRAAMSRSEWISVKERLPEIISVRKCGENTYRRSIRVLCACKQADGKQFVKEGFFEFFNNYPDPRWRIPGTIHSVTHWMPLPSPPVVVAENATSNKAWVEAERYHFFDFVSSQSTMHRIAKFDIEEQCNEYVLEEVIRCVTKLRDAYNTDPSAENYLRLLYNIPSGFQLTARMTTNYRQLKTIYLQRRNHRLPEWREFCKWIEELPMFKELILNG